MEDEASGANLSSSILRSDGISDGVGVLLLSILWQSREVGERSEVVILDSEDMSNRPTEGLELDSSRLRNKNKATKVSSNRFFLYPLLTLLPNWTSAYSPAHQSPTSQRDPDPFRRRRDSSPSRPRSQTSPDPSSSPSRKSCWCSRAGGSSTL